MRELLLLFMLGAVMQVCAAGFVISALNMSDQVFQDCQYCDARSDKAGSRATANSLRDYMTRNHIGFVVDKGDVRVEERYPDEDIDTGHSCSITAQANNVVARAIMVPGTVQLSPEGVFYIDEIQNSIAVADVQHTLTVDLNVRMRAGVKLFGRCRKLAQKTCSTDGISQGTNHISVNFAASNVLVECIGGQEHLTFQLDVRVTDEAKFETYGPVEVDRKGNCNIKFLGFNIIRLNSKVQSYANRYLRRGDRFTELRGTKLIAELERKLGATLGSTVNVQLNNIDGTPRLCARRKRATSCVRKSCPAGFTRNGETDYCLKYFGLSAPNCNQFGPTASVYAVPIGAVTAYYCQAPMVVA